MATGYYGHRILRARKPFPSHAYNAPRVPTHTASDDVICILGESSKCGRTTGQLKFCICCVCGARRIGIGRLKRCKLSLPLLYMPTRHWPVLDEQAPLAGVVRLMGTAQRGVRCIHRWTGGTCANQRWMVPAGLAHAIQFGLFGEPSAAPAGLN